ncbi:MAG: hypothetical protein K6E51_08850 [Treponema sp.]|nr:hypothetical protein [Treponema sp.]
MNPKRIIGAAIVGFVLSFFTGLFSGAIIGIVLLRAFIFACVFGALAFAILFLCEKFLDVGVSEPVAASEAPSGEVHIRRPGGTIDISIGEDELPREENEPMFYVSPTSPQNFVGEPLFKAHAKSAQTPASHTASPSAPVSSAVTAPDSKVAPAEVQSIQSATPVAPQEDKESQQFVPVPLGAQAAEAASATQQDVKKEPAQPMSAKKAAAVAAAAQQKAELAQLDQLPDLDGFSAGDDEGSVSDDATKEILQDSDVGESRSSESSLEAGLATASKSSGGADAELMAKAISTILSNEN